MKLIKKIYRFSKWYFLNTISLGKIQDVIQVNPREIAFGQTPQGQFPPRCFFIRKIAGDWDNEVLPIEQHLLYRSFNEHFVNDTPWETTPFYQFAKKSILQGMPFRGEYDTPEALDQRFAKCDNLYTVIQSDGFKSNHQLYSEGKTENILDLLDEITVNIGRDGSMILNDGWHRFTIARLLEVPNISVRIIARHSLS